MGCRVAEGGGGKAATASEKSLESGVVFVLFFWVCVCVFFFLGGGGWGRRQYHRQFPNLLITLVTKSAKHSSRVITLFPLERDAKIHLHGNPLNPGPSTLNPEASHFQESRNLGSRAFRPRDPARVP